MGLLTEISHDRKKPVIDPPGTLNQPVEDLRGGRGEAAGAAATATTEPEKKLCGCIRTRKIFLVDHDENGFLRWEAGCVTKGRQCMACGAIFGDPEFDGAIFNGQKENQDPTAECTADHRGTGAA